MREELKGFHGTCRWVMGLGSWIWMSLHSAFSRPEACYPEDGGDQKGLKRQPRPRHPGLHMKAGKLHIRHGHVEVRGKDGDEKQGEAAAGQKLNRARRNQQSAAAEELENAAAENAGVMKGNPGRHDRLEERGAAQVNRAGEEEERGEKKADESAEDQEKRL